MGHHQYSRLARHYCGFVGPMEPHRMTHLILLVLLSGPTVIERAMVPTMHLCNSLGDLHLKYGDEGADYRCQVTLAGGGQ